MQDPDYAIKDDKNEATVFMVKKLPDTNLNVVSKLALDTGEKKLKDSVMTFYRIRDRNLRKLIEKIVWVDRRSIKMYDRTNKFNLQLEKSNKYCISDQ